jgi:hypothetical protein
MRYLSEEYTTPDAAFVTRETVRSTYEARKAVARGVAADNAFISRETVRSTCEGREAGSRVDAGDPEDKPNSEKRQPQSWGWRKFTRRTNMASNGLLVVSLSGRLVGFCGKEAEVLETLMAANGTAVPVPKGGSSTLANLRRAGAPVWTTGKTARLFRSITVIAKRRYGQRTPLRPLDYASIKRKDIAR